jgi:SAM-dependent methyltransferase
MDEYTLKTRAWLDNRFRDTNSAGIYRAHQPIYGFRKGPCEFGLVSRYIRTYHIMRAIARLDAKSLLDVGAAEGYKAALAKHLFGMEAVASDLSPEACKRAEEIYHIRAVPADVHDLPFSDGEFDIVLCSETLEHVTDYRIAVKELMRVAKKAVIVTVPHEPEEKVEENINTAVPHGHIHAFGPDSFDYLKAEGLIVHSWKAHSSKMTIPGVLVDAMPVEYQSRWKFPKFVATLYNIGVPILRLFSSKHTAARLLRKDEEICRTSPTYTGLVVMILKDPASFHEDKPAPVDALKIVEFAVPYHYLKKS